MYRVNASFLLRVRRTGEVWLLTLQDLGTGQRLEFSSWESLQRHLRSLPPSRTRP